MEEEEMDEESMAKRAEFERKKLKLCNESFPIKKNHWLKIENKERFLFRDIFLLYFIEMCLNIENAKFGSLFN